MRRVLFLSFYTPPRPGIATNRTSQLLRYLPQYGWNPTVVTPLLPGADPDVVQTPYVDVLASLKRLAGVKNGSTHAALGVAPAAFGSRPNLRQRAIGFAYGLATYPDAQLGWLLHGRRAVRALLARERFDAILSSSPPFTTNLILAGLSLHVPWVADFRDLWGDARSGKGLTGVLDRRLERWTLHKAAALTTISEPMAQALRVRSRGASAHVIPNGFDPAEWASLPFDTEDRCTFVYAGQLFGGRRDPRPLFRALRTLLERGEVDRDDVRIDFYSLEEPWLTAAISEHGLTGIARVAGVVSRDAVLAAERRADRLLVLLWDEPGSEGVVTGKIFEYLGARRRILAVGGPAQSAVDPILESTGSGTRARDEDALMREITRAVAEHKASRVQLLDERQSEPYTAMAMARKFALVLDEVATSPKGRLDPAR